MGDIIPNQVSFKFRKRTNNTESSQNIEKFKIVELGNVTKKVHNAIIAALDMYFACKCDEFTISRQRKSI